MLEGLGELLRFFILFGDTCRGCGCGSPQFLTLNSFLLERELVSFSIVTEAIHLLLDEFEDTVGY